VNIKEQEASPNEMSEDSSYHRRQKEKKEKEEKKAGE
jgi:hypothetical protein